MQGCGTTVSLFGLLIFPLWQEYVNFLYELVTRQKQFVLQQFVCRFYPQSNSYKSNAKNIATMRFSFFKIKYLSQILFRIILVVYFPRLKKIKLSRINLSFTGSDDQNLYIRDNTSFFILLFLKIWDHATKKLRILYSNWPL